MKIKIDEQGYLSIWRAGKFKLQYCPYTSIGEQGFLNNKVNQAQCGDWCPLFEEPYYDVDLVFEFYSVRQQKTGKIALEICKKKFVVKAEDFIDERRQK